MGDGRCPIGVSSNVGRQLRVNGQAFAALGIMSSRLVGTLFHPRTHRRLYREFALGKKFANSAAGRRRGMRACAIPP